MANTTKVKDVPIMVSGDDINENTFPEEEVNDCDFPTRSTIYEGFNSDKPVGIAKNFRTSEGTIHCDALLWLSEIEDEENDTLTVELEVEHDKKREIYTDLKLRSLAIVDESPDEEIDGNIGEEYQ